MRLHTAGGEGASPCAAAQSRMAALWGSTVTWARSSTACPVAGELHWRLGGRLASHAAMWVRSYRCLRAEARGQGCAHKEEASSWSRVACPGCPGCLSLLRCAGCFAWCVHGGSCKARNTAWSAQGGAGGAWGRRAAGAEQPPEQATVEEGGERSHPSAATTGSVITARDSAHRKWAGGTGGMGATCCICMGYIQG